MGHPDSVVNYVTKDSIKESHNFDFGDYYFFENFVVSELKNSITFDWHKAQDLINKALNYYGNDFSQLHLISNRYNNYSVVAQDWKKFLRLYEIKTYCVVIYSRNAEINVVMEKLFFKTNQIHTFNHIKQALSFVLNQDK